MASAVLLSAACYKIVLKNKTPNYIAAHKYEIFFYRHNPLFICLHAFVQHVLGNYKTVIQYLLHIGVEYVIMVQHLIS